MKTKINCYNNRHYALVIDDPEKARDKQDVLAALSNYADSCCWQLVDIRLSQYWTPNPYSGSMPGENYLSHAEPKSIEEADYIKSRLREFTEEEDGSLLWCTFDGIVRGSPEIKGYRPPSWHNFNQSGYFSRADGLEKLKEIQLFWANIKSLDDDWRIENINRQPSLGNLQVESSTNKTLNEIRFIKSFILKGCVTNHRMSGIFNRA